MASSETGSKHSNVSSDPYHNYTNNFNILSSPASSTSHKRKRSEGLDIITHIVINKDGLVNQAINEHAKRCQQHKIHSELHQNTIEMMMKSQKILQEQERLHKLYDSANSKEDIDTSESDDSFKQRPFWPIINKVHI